MAEQYEVVAEVVSQKGVCEAGHKVGDRFAIGRDAPAGMCSWALHAILPFATVMRFGGTFPWEKDPDKATVACPDAENPVVFELQRSPKKGTFLANRFCDKPSTLTTEYRNRG